MHCGLSISGPQGLCQPLAQPSARFPHVCSSLNDLTGRKARQGLVPWILDRLGQAQRGAMRRCEMGAIFVGARWLMFS